MNTTTKNGYKISKMTGFSFQLTFGKKKSLRSTKIITIEGKEGLHHLFNFSSDLMDIYLFIFNSTHKPTFKRYLRCAASLMDFRYIMTLDTMGDRLSYSIESNHPISKHFEFGPTVLTTQMNNRSTLFNYGPLICFTYSHCSTII